MNQVRRMAAFSVRWSSWTWPYSELSFGGALRGVYGEAEEMVPIRLMTFLSREGPWKLEYCVFTKDIRRISGSQSVFRRMGMEPGGCGGGEGWLFSAMSPALCASYCGRRCTSRASPLQLLSVWSVTPSSWPSLVSLAFLSFSCGIWVCFFFFHFLSSRGECALAR